MKKISLILIVLLAITVIISSCDKDDDDGYQGSTISFGPLEISDLVGDIIFDVSATNTSNIENVEISLIRSYYYVDDIEGEDSLVILKPYAVLGNVIGDTVIGTDTMMNVFITSALDIGVDTIGNFADFIVRVPVSDGIASGAFTIEVVDP